MNQNWKQRVDEISARLGRTQLSDQELFTSPEYNQATQTWAENMVYGVCSLLRARGYNITEEEEESRASRLELSVVYDSSENSMTAATNGSQIIINAGNKLVRALDTQYLRHYAVQGFRVHEVGHVLFSANKSTMHWYNSITNGFWWPTAPTVDGSNELSAKLNDPKWRDVFLSFANSMRNALEDAYIENEIFTIFGGVPSTELATVDDVQIQTASSFMSMVNDTETGKNQPKSIRVLSALMSQILMYAKYGILMIDGCDAQVQEMFDTVTPIIDGAKIERDPKKRLEMLNDVLCSCFFAFDDAVQDILKEMQNKQQKQQPQNGQSAGSGIPTQGNNAGSGNSSGQPSGNSGNTGSQQNEGSASSQANTQMQPNASTKQLIMDTIQKAANSLGIDMSAAQQNGQASQSGSKSAPANSIFQAGKAPASEKVAQPMQKPTSGGKPDLEAAKVEIDMLKHSVDTRMAQCSVEKTLAHELQNEANQIANTSIHINSIGISRAASIDDLRKAKQVYDSYAAEILPVVKNLQRKFQSVIKDEENDDTISGLMMGTRIEARTLYHRDGKYFSRKNFPREAPRLAIGYLCDESGSMSQTAIRQSIKAGILIENLCKRMELPCIISGYTSGRGTAHIISYVEPNSVDGNDKYRLLGMSSRGSTPTAPALTYMAARLMKLNASTRLLIVSTDGSSDDGVSTMNKVVKDAKKKGIVVIGAGIGASRSAIEREFLNAYLDVSNIEKLPDNLLKLIKKLLMY